MKKRRKKNRASAGNWRTFRNSPAKWCKEGEENVRSPEHPARASTVVSVLSLHESQCGYIHSRRARGRARLKRGPRKLIDPGTNFGEKRGWPGGCTQAWVHTHFRISRELDYILDREKRHRRECTSCTVRPRLEGGKRGCRGSAGLGHVVKLMRHFLWRGFGKGGIG